MRLPARVRLFEVGPRDGLQNEAVPVSTEIKIALVERLAGAGMPAIEAGAFVSPKWVPLMADSGAVFAGIARREGVRYTALTPNLQGYQAARAARVDEVAIFGAATESFSRRNLNCSIAESLDRFAPVAAAARADGVPVRGYISCVLGCPYEGAVAPSAVVDVARRLDAMGCYEVSVGDTIGVGTPGMTEALIDALAAHIPVARLAVHFHDTYGQALANILVALQHGVATVDTSVAGLGGCPYAPGASGNVASEDVLYMLNGLGVATGVDLDALADAGAYICQALGRPPASRVARALQAKRGATTAPGPAA